MLLSSWKALAVLLLSAVVVLPVDAVSASCVAITQRVHIVQSCWGVPAPGPRSGCFTIAHLFVPVIIEAVCAFAGACFVPYSSTSAALFGGFGSGGLLSQSTL